MSFTTPLRGASATNVRRRDTRMKVAIIKCTLLAASLFLFGGHVWNSARIAARARAQVGGGSVSKTSQTKTLFNEWCARCHGQDGRGQTKMGEMLEPPDFTDAEWQKGTSDEQVKNSIRNGVGQMPSFARKLSRRDIAALVAYVRGFAKPGR